jgi:hypothetical protein
MNEHEQLLESYSKELENVRKGKDILNLRESIIRTQIDLLQHEQSILLARAVAIQTQRPQAENREVLEECPNVN